MLLKKAMEYFINIYEALMGVIVAILIGAIIILSFLLILKVATLEKIM